MDELRILLETIMKALDLLEADVKKASLEGAEEGALEKAKTAYDAKHKEFKDTTEKLKTVMESEAEKVVAKALIASVAAAKKTLVPAGAGVLAGAGPAQARDIDQEAKDKQVIFFKYCIEGNKAMSGNEMLAVAPRSLKWDKAKDGIVMPKSLAKSILGPRWAQAIYKDIPSLSSNNAEGGFLVPPDFRPTPLELPVEPTHIMNLATVVSAPTGQIEWPKILQTDANEFGSVDVTFIAEGASKTATQAKFEQQIINTFELSAYTELTHRLLRRSATDLEALLTRLFRSAIMDKLDQVFITGTGSGEPLGIINTTGIRLVKRKTKNTIDYDDLVDLKYALQPHHRAGAWFMMEDGVAQTLEKTRDNDGRPLFTSSTAAGLQDRLVGKPWFSSTRPPKLGLEGDIACGDFREYIVAVEEEVVVKRSDDFQFRNNVAAFAVFTQVGGELVQPRVFSILDDLTS